MRGLRRLRFLALAAVLTTAAGCATVPSPTAPAAATPSPASAASRPTPAPLASGPTAAASAAADAPDDQMLQQALDQPDTAPKYTDIWQRIRSGFAIPDMNGPEMQPYVNQAVGWYRSRPDYVARMTERSRKYLYYIVQEVQRRGLPTELALLPFVESAFNPQAQSPAQASGMWQFIPSTGTRYNLRQTLFNDGRRDIMASTKAALDYLTQLHSMFGDWQLALAAYNWGEGGVQRAIARNQARGLPTDYGDLRMPAETRNYYPKLQAIKEIIADPAAYGITLPEVPDHPYFKPVTVTQDMDVDVAARLAGISVSEFHSLNPSFRKPVILAAAHPRILLPYDNATTFEQAVADAATPLSSWTTYAVRRTASPDEIARQLDVAEATLREVNKIPARTLVKAGSTLLVPKTAQDTGNVTPDQVRDAVLALAPEAPALRARHVRARAGDTPLTVARRFGVTASDVARWNHVATRERFRVRTELVVYVPGASSARHVRVATKRRAERVADARHSPRIAAPHHGRHVKVAESRRRTRHSLSYSLRTPGRGAVRVAER